MKKTKIDLKNNIEASTNRISLTLLFAFVAFVLLGVSVGIALALIYLLSIFGVVSFDIESISSFWNALLFMAGISIIVGMILTSTLGRFPLRPFNKLITQMNKLAAGKFKTRLHFGKPISAHPAFSDIEKSFNKLAEELDNTEVLRTDFINNFSHEFKTPIVSITGFAKLLRHGNLTEEQKNEYLAIIEEESLRLSHMATNVLNLTKIENQTILTDVTRFNLSEQIRSAILLLEPEWEKTCVEFDIDSGEVYISANEDLLKQVWVNLIDNSLKFSKDGSTIGILITESPAYIAVSISNPGEIPQDNIERIWNKFYQGDTSHSRKGNGIGLAIVKRVVELHNGSYSVKSSGGTVTFTVVLPKNPKIRK